MATRETRLTTLPMLVLRGLVCFPETVNHFDVGRLKSVAALNAAMENDQRIFLVTQKDVKQDDPEPKDLYRMGIIAHVRQIVKLPHDNFRIIVEGECRATAVEILQHTPYFVAVVEERQDRRVTSSVLEDALVRECRQQFERYAELTTKMAPDVLLSVRSEERRVGKEC